MSGSDEDDEDDDDVDDAVVGAEEVAVLIAVGGNTVSDVRGASV
jgi:hypothetical protein